MESKYFPEDIQITEATKKQKLFSKELVLKDKIPVALETVGGVSVYSRGNNVSVSICLLETDSKFSSFEVKEKDIISKEVKFPSVPAFEGFREGEMITDTVKRLGIPNVLMVEGHGIDHPRGFGLASHVGLALDSSTLGVSKDLLGGEVKTVKGKEVVLKEGDVVAKVVKKKTGAPKFYVSPGNKITMDTAAKIAKKSMKSSMPEPIKIARDNLLDDLKSQR